MFKKLRNCILYLVAAFVVLHHCQDNDKSLEKNEYIFSGRIDKSSYTNFLNYLNTHQVDTIYLNSEGGDVEYAMEMGDIIMIRGIDTVIGKYAICNSACIYLFMSGNHKTMYSPIGIHAPAIDGIPYEETIGKNRKALDDLKEDVVVFMAHRGLNRDFVEMMFGIPNKSLVFINKSVMLKYTN